MEQVRERGEPDTNSGSVGGEITTSGMGTGRDTHTQSIERASELINGHLLRTKTSLLSLTVFITLIDDMLVSAWQVY